MENKKKLVLNIIRLLVILAFFLGVGTIIVYPFGNRNLIIEVTAEQEILKIYQSKSEIEEAEIAVLDLPQKDSLKIKEIKIFSNFKTIFLKKIAYAELAGYIAEVPQGEMEWQDDGLIFTGNNGIHIVMNETFNKLLKDLSASYLIERILMLELLLILCSVCLIICKAVEEKIASVKRDNHGPIYEFKKFIADIKKYGQYMIYAAKTDLKAEVANSYLNRLWWLLEPFFNMLVYVIVFGKAMGKSVENYSTFIFAALLMWNFFSKTINYSVKLVRNNKDIVTKVYVPKFILLLSNMFLNIFKLLFSLIVLIIMMIVFKVHIGFNIFWVLPAYVVMILLSFGIGMICLHFGVYVDDLSYAVAILLNMLMFLSGIFYEVMTSLPEPLNTFMMCLNPVAVFVDTMRNALLNNMAVNLPTLGIWFTIAVILCCIGVHIVYKNENGYVKVV